MDEYQLKVKQALASRDGEPLFNGSAAHASVILEEMFMNAQSSMKILSSALNRDVYGNEKVVREFSKFLENKAHRVEIMLDGVGEDCDLDGHPLSEVLKAENCEVRYVPVNERNSYDFHIALMDDDGYRFEADKTKHEAVIAFGHKAGSKNLGEVFAFIWGLCPKH